MVSIPSRAASAEGSHRRPGQSVECGWCGQTVPVPSRDRVPKWCSATCRNRAWQANYAPDHGPVRVVQQRDQFPVPKAEPRNVDEWCEVLELLSTRLAQGRIYTRDLPVLLPAITRMINVTERRIRER